ncbi:MAG: large conductance mechanosensitive channel protein MscL [Ktedonobacteraceae bacterium]|nr:large conductance mechanosensitive channel protein MscL [Ktedonobacteraceae bacterium]
MERGRFDREQTVNTLRGLGARGWQVGTETLGGFRKFILRGNVVDLAVGIVIGAAFSSVVNELVKDLITPLIGLFGGFNFPAWSFTVNKSVFALGAFLNAVVSFLIMAAVIYFFVVLPITKLQDRFLPKAAEAPTTRECPFCLSSMPLKATRCMYCTSQLPPAEAPAEQAPSGI